MIFVCWLWRGTGFWKRTAAYDERHVDVLASMLRRHGGHEMVCVHDGTFKPGCESIVMPAGVAGLPDYLPKLWAWSPDIHRIIGRRFASIDLDVVICGDLAPALATRAPLRIWNKASREAYNSSLFSLEPGYGHAVWETMTPAAVEAARDRAEYWTGDQSWIAHVLGSGEENFGEETGVMQYRPHLHRGKPPDGLVAGFMCGPYEPFSEAEQSPWVKASYR